MRVIYRAAEFYEEDSVTPRRTALHRQVVTDEWPYLFERWDMASKQWVESSQDFDADGFDASSPLVRILESDALVLLRELGGNPDDLRAGLPKQLNKEEGHGEEGQA